MRLFRLGMRHSFFRPVISSLPRRICELPLHPAHCCIHPSRVSHLHALQQSPGNLAMRRMLFTMRAGKEEELASASGGDGGRGEAAAEPPLQSSSSRDEEALSQRGPVVVITRPLPRVLILHTGGTLGMDMVGVLLIMFGM